ncbi:MAG: hypothetical protein GOMPHAMPRED_001006 [Gomphillus americanus]|uniref:Uncharacterized protein n=1 Tax=Gomphillus americanus TaxID=1940652 RepID=A0A8H3F179_9LECA|nr:MAG: hypothetical protein GOMPHAMPRED_001006 [Gomphillus americanus]
MPEDSAQVDAVQEQSTWQKAERAFKSKQLSEFFDPCQEAASRSIKCLHRNGGDRSMCTDYFAAYRECKKEWLTEKKFKK